MPVVELELAASRARRLVLRMLKSSPQGHVGGALSAIDIITALYLREMNIDPANPKSKERDRLGVSQTLLEAAITQPRPVFSCFVNLLQSEEARKQIILVIDGPAA